MTRRQKPRRRSRATSTKWTRQSPADDDEGGALQTGPLVPVVTQPQHPTLKDYLQRNPAFNTSHAPLPQRPKRKTKHQRSRRALPGTGQDGAHLDGSLTRRAKTKRTKIKPYDSEADSPPVIHPPTKMTNPFKSSEPGTDTEQDTIPGYHHLKKHTLAKIKAGMYVVITDCIPNYAETDDVDGIMFTLDGQAKSTRLSNSRPAIPTNFEEWFAGASVLCRAREFFNPALLTSNNAYIEWVRQLYRSYSPATVYEYDAAWRSYCSIDNISFWPISPHFMKGAIILQRGCLLVSARSHCIHCQSVTHK